MKNLQVYMKFTRKSYKYMHTKDKGIKKMDVDYKNLPFQKDS